MKEALEHYKQNYFIDIGDKKLSPVSQISIGLCMEYMEGLQKNITYQNPFFVCFPNKKWATVWLSIGLLNHFFLEDYVYQKENKLEDLKIGDRISIFGKLSIWRGNNNLLVTQSSPGAYGKTTSEITYTIPDCWKPHINKDTTLRKRIISMGQLRKELGRRRQNRTALDKILTYDEKEGLGVNPNVLKLSLIHI